jgi:hypothetical protein
MKLLFQYKIKFELEKVKSLNVLIVSVMAIQEVFVSIK